MMRRAVSFLCFVGWGVVVPGAPTLFFPGASLEPVAEQPALVTPVAVDVSPDGAVAVIESNTHFPPKGYSRSPHDRIWVWRDGTQALFHEGTVKTMSIKWGPDTWLYLATRDRILRVRDTTGNGVADTEETLATLTTEADYPHNALCGLAFDGQGRVYFGMGENFGKAYRLEAKDGSAIVGGPEGGNVFAMGIKGERLSQVASGFWNPFGLCFLQDGRLLLTDNDPDAAPPNRLIEVFGGGDYGFQMRYGRAGTHPLQSWDGELPGTLGMLAGVGEAACEIIEVNHSGWPAEWQGDLLVASWGDHRVERLTLEANGAVKMTPLIQGGDDFRPVGLGMAPDGTLWISDWRSRSYTLHSTGRLWRVNPPKKDGKPGVSVPGRVAQSPLLRDDTALGRLAMRRHQMQVHEASAEKKTAAIPLLKEALASDDPAVRGLAIRWAAETKTASVVADIEASVDRPGTDARHFKMALAALAWIEQGKPGLPAGRLRQRMETTYPTGQRVLAARSLPASDKVFAPETVKAAFAEAPEALQVELLRAVAGRADRDEAWLTTVAQSADQPASVQAEAALAMGAYPEVGNASAEEVGRRLFFSRKKVNCALCHLMDGRGGILGPDLSRLNMTEERLRESMDHPSREIAPKYQTLVYTLKSEEVVTGIKLSLQDRTSRDHDRLIVADGSVRLVPLGEIVSREVSPISMMPPALLSTLTEAEQKALVQFLLRARP